MTGWLWSCRSAQSRCHPECHLREHEHGGRNLAYLAGLLRPAHPDVSPESSPLAVAWTRERLVNLKRTLEPTNPCESMIEICRSTSRNVKNWQSGDMCLRWTAAGMLEAEHQFRRIIGYRDLAKLVIAIERELDQPTVPTPNKEPAIVLTA